jgi:hypothetical protein
MSRYTVVLPYYLTALALLLCVAVSYGAAAQPSPEVEARLDVERAKLVEEQKRTNILEKAEQRLQRSEQEHWMLIAGAIGTPLTLIVSILGAALGYHVQRRAEMRQLEAQFKLKAAEIVMAARSADQIYNKAKALADLLPAELATLGESFNPTKFKLGQTIERRQALIELLAANPGARNDTIRTWAILFPHDRDDWLKPLLKAEEIEI